MGMQPQLRQVPPSSARSIRVDVRPQLRRAQRRDVAGRAAAQHDDAWFPLRHSSVLIDLPSLAAEGCGENPLLLGLVGLRVALTGLARRARPK